MNREILENIWLSVKTKDDKKEFQGKEIHDCSDIEIMGYIASSIMFRLDVGHWEEIIGHKIPMKFTSEGAQFDISDSIENKVKEYCVEKISEFLECIDFENDLKIFRWVVVHRDEHLVSSGNFGDIGINWSLSDNIDGKDFIEQYGNGGSLCYMFNATCSPKDIMWAPTLIAQCDPYIQDYNEVVLSPDVSPKTLSHRFVEDVSIKPSSETI